MKKFLITLIFSLSLSEAQANECSAGKDYVTRVIDGDTIEVNGNQKIRILGIDAYDTNKTMATKQSKRTGYKLSEIKFLSEKAKRGATNLLLNECVRLERDYLNIDRYGRFLRYVEIQGKDYQRIVLEMNLANVYCGDRKIERFKKYLEISQFKC